MSEAATNAADPASPERLQARIDALEEQVRSHPQRLSKWMRFLPFLMIGNLLLAGPAFIISGALAYFTFKQAGATERMQVAEAWPFLTFETGNYDLEGNRLISLNLANDGIYNHHQQYDRSIQDMVEGQRNYRGAQQHVYQDIIELS